MTHNKKQTEAQKEYIRQIGNLVQETELESRFGINNQQDELLYRLAFPMDTSREYEHVIGKIIGSYLAEALFQYQTKVSDDEIFTIARDNLIKRLNGGGFIITPTKEEIMLVNAAGKAKKHDTKHGLQTADQTAMTLYFGFLGEDALSKDEVAEEMRMSSSNVIYHVNKGIRNILQSDKIPSERHGNMLFYLTDDELLKAIHDYKFGKIAKGAGAHLINSAHKLVGEADERPEVLRRKPDDTYMKGISTSH